MYAFTYERPATAACHQDYDWEAGWGSGPAP